MTTLERTFALLLVAAFLLLVYVLQPILMPFLVGFVIAYLGDPLVDRLERVGLGRTLGVVVVFVFFLSILVAALLVLMPLLVEEINALMHRIPGMIRWLQQTVSPVMVQYFNVDPFALQVDELRGQLTENWRQAGGIASRVLAEVTRSGFALMAWIANFALIPVVAFYLMRDWDGLIASLRELLPREMEPVVVGLASECDEVLSAFLRGQLLVMITLGVIYAAGLYVIGLDLALLIGLLAGLASIVPYLGFVVGILAASVAAIFQFQELSQVVLVALVFGAGQAIEGMVLTPLLVGDRIGLHPVAVIFAILAGGQMFGFVGILLALPVAAIVMVFLRHAHGRYVSSVYYGAREPEDGPPTTP